LWKYAAIRGAVIDDLGDPVVSARVEAWPSVFVAGRPWFNSVTPYTGRTDDRGFYRIPKLLAGDYVVVVPAFSLTMPPVALVQPNVEPWTADVVALLRRFNPADVQDVGAADPGRGLSDGGWRVSWLGQPTPPPGASASGYPTTFAPNALGSAEAAVVSVRPGDEVVAPPVQLPLRPLHRVAGLVVGAGTSAGHAALRLSTSDTDVGLAVADSQGRFELAGVPEGTYHLSVVQFPLGRGTYSGVRSAPADGMPLTSTFATAPLSEAPTEWADVTITVGTSDVDGVAVTLTEGVRLSGHVVFVGGRPAANALRLLTLTVDRSDGRPQPVWPKGEIAVTDRGTFRSVELPPGRYFLRASGLAGWSLGSAVVGGHDISVTPIDLTDGAPGDIAVTLTTTPSELTGFVRSGTGHGDPDATVVAFPVDRAQWVDFGASPRNIVTVRADAAGHYVVQNLSPGDYFVIGLDDTVVAQGYSPRFFDTVARLATRVHVAEGGPVSVDLVKRDLAR
jgi:hypothetical protein